MGRRSISTALCAALLALFAITSWRAASTKSPTFDEIYYPLAGWIYLQFGDVRMNPVHPPLSKCWMALPHARDKLRVDVDSVAWRRYLHDTDAQTSIAVGVLFQTEGNDGLEFIRTSRAMMLIWGVVLGALVGWWSAKIGGALAAVASVALYTFDPNFLAHAPLATNDVAISLALFGFAFAVWRLGQRVTVLRAVAAALWCGAALSIKFTALVLPALAVLLLIARALMNEPWTCLGLAGSTRRSRLLIAAGLLVFLGVSSYVAIWATYGFRFLPSNDPELRIEYEPLLRYAAVDAAMSKYSERMPTEAEIEAYQPDLLIRWILWADRVQLLPQAYLSGLLFNYAVPQAHNRAYLLGEIGTSWWYYFPVAMLVKTPASILLLSAAGFVFSLGWIYRSVLFPRAVSTRWTVLCLTLPLAAILSAAILSGFNIGLRHVLPFYPFLYVALGVLLSRACATWPRRAAVVAAVLAVALVGESLAAYPDYLSFFNVMAGGQRGGFHILGDSNLDWGQDLPALAEWQREHPETKLYLCYFGSADPGAYGIQYTNLPGGYPWGPPETTPGSPGVVAISATNMQGIYYNAARRRYYRPYHERQPLEVLGGSIYLFTYPESQGVQSQRAIP